MKKVISIVSFLALIICLIPGIADAKLVACVGDSITYGEGVSNRESNCYPMQLSIILQSVDSDSNWEAQNFGHSGATLLRNKSASYVTKTAYSLALASEPDVVVIQLGSNDSARATSSEIEQRFVSDYLALIDAFAQLPSQPKIFVCNPPPIFGGSYGSNTKITDLIIPFIEQLPTHRDVEVIDLYTLFEDSGHLFPDKLHPNAEGARMIAETVASMILGFRFLPDFNGDAKIDIEDLIILIEHWEQDEPSLDVVPSPFGDGLVDRADLEVLMNFWGQEIDDPTLIAHWKLDETEGTIAYESVSDVQSDLFGDPVWQPADGMIDGALMLDGIDDFVGTWNIPGLSAERLSVFAWVKGGAASQVVVSQYKGVNWLTADASQGYLKTDLKGTGDTAQSLVSEVTITDGQWHRIGLSWDGTNRVLYVDDVAVASDTQTSLELSAMGLNFGCGPNETSNTFFSGLIDDVRIYNRAVTP